MDDFFTLASFGTLAGSVAGAVVIINTLRHAFNWGPRWFGLIVSILVAVVAWQITASSGAHSKTVDLGFVRYLIVFFNGCLIYTSAFGIQNTIVTEKPGMSFQSLRREDKLRFRSPW